MDYEFRCDLYGTYQAQFSMGHEAFGIWLTEELAADVKQLTHLLERIDELQTQQCREHQHTGRGFVLTMMQSGVEVRAKGLDEESGSPDELHYYDQESEACCGLDDFRQLLEAWQHFITSPRRR